jgi:hypothetical protein
MSTFALWDSANRFGSMFPVCSNPLAGSVSALTVLTLQISEEDQVRRCLSRRSQRSLTFYLTQSWATLSTAVLG